LIQWNKEKTRAQAFDLVLRWIDFEKNARHYMQSNCHPPAHSERRNGRSPIGLERMLAIHFIQYYAQQS